MSGISTERAIELEFWLLDNCSIGMNRMNKAELLNLLTTKNFNKKEIEYLIGAYYMPIIYIRKKLLFMIMHVLV